VLLGPGNFIAPRLGRRVINSAGQFIGHYVIAPSTERHALFYGGSGGSTQAIGNPDAELASGASNIAESGLVAGTTLGTGADSVDPMIWGFAWTASKGKTSVPGGKPEFVTSSADFTATRDLVGGRLCTVIGACMAFIWDTASPTLSEYPNFDPRWMNDAATMVGFIDPLSAPHLDTLTREGRLTTLMLDDTPDTTDHFIADDGTVFLNISHAIVQGDFKAGAIAFVDGVPMNIGRGVATLPVNGARPSSEVATFTAYSAGGSAAGVDRFDYIDTSCGELRQAAAAFVWSAATGTTRVDVGAQQAVPTAVNRDGVVVGYTVDDGKPFVWTRSAGGVPLETLIAGPGADIRLGHAVAVGDGGHILVESDQGIVLLRPNAP
jgi:hypothetical protein